MPDASSLPGHFYLWEMATAVAGHVLGINPFDQPDVESTKIKTKEVLSAGGQAVWIEREEKGENLMDFLSGARVGSYVAIQAFLDPLPAVGRALDRLKDKIRERTGLPVTLGFGPRYLHSTGQLHKGDAGRGFFIQLDLGSENRRPDPGSRRGAPGGVLRRAILRPGLGGSDGPQGRRPPSHPHRSGKRLADRPAPAPPRLTFRKSNFDPRSRDVNFLMLLY